MANKLPASKVEFKLERTIRYLDLMVNLWDVRSKLRNEFPDKFFDANEHFAQKMLDRGLIKCKHEQA